MGGFTFPVRVIFEKMVDAPSVYETNIQQILTLTPRQSDLVNQR